MSQADDLDELRRQYAALGFGEAPLEPASQQPEPAPSASANLDELQKQYEALGFGEASQTASKPLADPLEASSGSQLEELQKQYDSMFGEAEEDGKHRPPALDIGEQTGDSFQASVPTPDSSSASTGHATSIAMVSKGLGGLDDFAMYQRFRLTMVKMFGSLASALFELGAHPETGRISRADFEEVLSGRLQLFTRAEANSLFSHATNADILDGGQGGFATYRDFTISEDEWRMVVAAKTNNGTQKSAMPFQSGPSGHSLGTFHRPIRLEEVIGGTPPSSKGGVREGSAASKRSGSKGLSSRGGEPKVASTAEGDVEETEFSTTATSGAFESRPATQLSPRARQQRRLRRKVGSSGQRVWPWRLPQKP